MKEGLVHDERLINVKNVKGLSEVASDNGIIRIGALCTHHQLETSPLLEKTLVALVHLEQNVANVRVRQVGDSWRQSLFAEPHADPGILLVAMLRWLRRNLAESAKFPRSSFLLTPMRQG